MGSSQFGGDRPGGFGLPSSGGPTYIEDMEAIAGLEKRVTSLESEVKEVKNVLRMSILPLLERIDKRLDGIEGRLGKVETDLARLDGRVSQLPSTIQLLGFAVAVLVAGGVLKYFLP